MKFKDYYQILGVSREATQDDLKRAYRRLVRKYHPDVSKEADAEARFKELGEAYEVLKDPEKRAAYDRLGTNFHAGDDFTPPPGWEAAFDFRRGFGSGGNPLNFSEFFETLFTGARGSRSGSGFGGRPQSQGNTRFTGRAKARGSDEHAKILVSLEDAYGGAERILQLQLPDAVTHGRVATRMRRLRVKVPAGIVQGQQIRLAGQGHPGTRGGPRGDLYLEVEFQSHPLFRAEGKDIHMDLPVAPWEAALGSTIKVPTLGGNVDLKIPPGSQSGRKLRLKGRGLGSQQPGDQYVVLQIMIPAADTESAREFYKRMAREMSFNPRARMDV